MQFMYKERIPVDKFKRMACTQIIKTCFCLLNTGNVTISNMYTYIFKLNHYKFESLNQETDRDTDTQTDIQIFCIASNGDAILNDFIEIGKQKGINKII